MRKRLTIEEMRKVARSRGGKCLSKEYKNIIQKLKWRCAKGHEWEARAQNVRTQGSWCPRCSKKRLTIEEINELAASRGGKCLSTEYKNINALLKWRCGKGHEWEAPVSNIKYSRSWCPECARQRIRGAQKARHREGKLVQRKAPESNSSDGVPERIGPDNQMILM